MEDHYDAAMRPRITMEDLVKDAWARLELPVAELERALDDYWEWNVLPDWFAPQGMSMRREIR
jgi:hypothetical protein